MQCDLRALPDLGGFDLVTCFDDSLNYLLDEADLTAAFAGMEAALAPGGVVFDLNSLLAYRTTFASQSVSESDETVFAWRGSCSPHAPPGCEAEVVLDVFAPYDELVEQRRAAAPRRRRPSDRCAPSWEDRSPSRRCTSSPASALRRP